MTTPSAAKSFHLKSELNPGYIWLISVVAALGGLLFGYEVNRARHCPLGKAPFAGRSS